MNNPAKYITVVVLAALAFCAEAAAQMHPERKHIRAGYRDYEALDYGASEGDFRTAAMKNPASFEAMFNLGDALYKQERYEEAENTFKAILENPQEYMLDGDRAAKVQHNLGNVQFAQQKLKEAAESYENSLMSNPSDLETKFNLAYVQKLMEEQENGGGDNDDNQDQNQDQDQNQNQNDQSDGNDNKDQDKQDGDQEQDQSEKDDKSGDDEQEKGDQPDKPDQSEKPEGQPQPREGAMSKADAEKMLEIMQQEEDKTRDKVNEKQAATTTKSGKNW